MPASQAPVPGFRTGSAGAIFTLTYPPPADVSESRWVVFVPPFAEELNRCRRMVSLQAQRFSALGYGVVVFDLFGTGDSAGDFAEARWEIWLEDLHAIVAASLRQGAGSVTLWALRAGALLAADLLRSSDNAISQLVLWQPQLQGKLALQQFLRLRTVASAMESGANRVTGRMLLDSLHDGHGVEVAGYLLAPELAVALENAAFEPLPAALRNIWWFEVGGADAQPSPVAQRLATDWNAAGCGVAVAAVEGELFWSTPEIGLAPALLAATSEALREHV